MATVVTEALGSATGVKYRGNGVVVIVLPARASPPVLLRNVLTFQTTIMVVSHGCLVIHATRRITLILFDILDLISDIVSINYRRIRAAAFPVQDLGLPGTTKLICENLLLSLFRLPIARIDCAFVSERPDLTSAAAATCVIGLSVTRILACSTQRTAFPVISLLCVVPTSDVVSRRTPVGGNFSRIGSLNRSAHLVIDRQLCFVPATAA